MTTRMIQATRLAVMASVVILGALSLTACSATGSASAGSAQQQAQGQGRPPGVSGAITGVDGTTISVQSASATSKVQISSATSLTRSVSASLADVSVGSCVLARSTPGASGSGTQAVSTVAISAPGADGTCSAATGGMRGAPGAGGSAPGGGGAPSGRQGGFTPPVQGSVTAVSGSTVTVQPPSGASSSAQSSFVVDSATTYTRSEAATSSDLTVGECVVASGTTAASGAVDARTVAISAQGPNGCTAGFGGRFAGGGQ